jgi:hypothetical protein
MPKSLVVIVGGLSFNSVAVNAYITGTFLKYKSAASAESMSDMLNLC